MRNRPVRVDGDSFVGGIVDNNADFSAGLSVYDACDDVHPPLLAFLGSHEPYDSGNVLYAHSRSHGSPPVGRYFHLFRGSQVVPPVALCSGNFALGCEVSTRTVPLPCSSNIDSSCESMAGAGEAALRSSHSNRSCSLMFLSSISFLAVRIPRSFRTALA